MAQKKSEQKGSGRAVGFLGLAAAAAAGAYFLYGSKEGAKRRAKVRGWALKAKGEVLDKLETMKEVNEDAYNKIVDTVTDKYKKAKNIDVAELALLSQDLKRHWGNIKRQMNTGAGAKKAAPKRRPAPKKQSGGSSAK